MHDLLNYINNTTLSPWDVAYTHPAFKSHSKAEIDEMTIDKLYEIINKTI